ncbi:non-structural maintenance of chromosomes element 4 homolog A [Monodelphis domestica]|uniref:non-structural maintenance of chromosomes element 4 homolog A n=1 Tax=Monodelphis domestica TaxID=13616 RepID=UPI0024E227E7|nr:non-structural maintenance of chromosomes element 4 homolog A [Monodelphis domestica]XP_056659139.1 non-structural maintenance of chromosomes element 4 homolog A [Monodelphis domestica]
MSGNYGRGAARAGTSRQRDSLPPAPREASGCRTPQRSQGMDDRGDGVETAEDDTCQTPGASEPNLELEGDDCNRRLIRHQYRELIHNVQQQREDMLSSKSNKLTDALEQANQLFNRVSQAREAALDAQFLVLASDLGKEKANQLHSDMTLFDPSSFAEDLLKFMGLNRLEVEESDSEEETIIIGFLPQDSWLRIGLISIRFLKSAPTFHFLFGSFKTDPPVPKQRNERQKRKDNKEEERAMPAELKKMEESHQEATEKEVERILGLLQTYFREEPETPISFFDFVIDPDSFARTVENIFHVSFIIRDGFARIRLDQDKLPIIEPITQRNEESEEESTQIRHQDIISLSYQDWKDIVRTFEISQPMISPPCCSK